MTRAQRLIAVLVVFLWPSFAVGQKENERLLADADPAIQAQIGMVFNSKGEVDVVQQLQVLEEMTDDKAELVEQLAVFAVIAPNQKEFHDIKTLMILHRLELAPSITIRVLAPYLGSNNEQLREFARLWFQGHDTISNDPLEPVNYKPYAEYIGGLCARNEEVPAAFAEYIFERSPERALLAFHRGSRARHAVAQLEAISKAFKARKRGEEATVEMPERPDDPPRDILLAAHIVDNAIWLKVNKFEEHLQGSLPVAREKLTELAERKEWWVRLYVAEIMRRHPELRIADVLDELRDDENASVSNAARSVKP